MRHTRLTLTLHTHVTRTLRIAHPTRTIYTQNTCHVRALATNPLHSPQTHAQRTHAPRTHSGPDSEDARGEPAPRLLRWLAQPAAGPHRGPCPSQRNRKRSPPAPHFASTGSAGARTPEAPGSLRANAQLARCRGPRVTVSRPPTRSRVGHSWGRALGQPPISGTPPSPNPYRASQGRPPGPHLARGHVGTWGQERDRATYILSAEAGTLPFLRGT